ncbi:beta-galactosidase [Halolactibacillus alkaliphilus]|uniref:Beta-galactosidase n=1 Tax=Halolactibacillus alkaliphilus TaxID=442899 RepID=A0A511X1A1_9BACI|nr:beta-galactosidase [Halolactibacillus alkaliphilus]GEN56732.1 beta-galactosidase [Halolactibacillus alkaliphilus]GGN70944.1 beta-galactosidase [Halolactibacillus alkaliphilus]SFO80120.1 beta-galactosidase [Halolactibacillus alkaliphilus]
MCQAVTKKQVMLHGADYNPEQWAHDEAIFEEDLRLMKKAKVNVMSVGIFSWAKLEPEEGIFDFNWLDTIINRLYDNGISVFLATPTGARPTWMSEKYPEVLRVTKQRQRNLHGMRHNHCYTSPVYREKTTIMNTKLAERYSAHPAVLGWHISNEYGGDCHCDYCQQAFREWVKDKYETLDALNHAWWTTFWSHTYTSFTQVESPAPHGEEFVHGQNIDWKRFVTDQTLDFYRHEVKPLKEKNANIPVTANFMELFEGLNYDRFKDDLDIVSWDSYPTWHFEESDLDVASYTAMNHDWFRSLKDGKPFLLMESTPSLTNWQAISKLKKPGVHHLSSLQAVAHGSDSVQYFQWRKSRGSSEKFHGAVVDHVGHEHTRVFKDVAAVGASLETLAEVVGTRIDAKVALIFDTENRWAINDAQGPRNSGVHYEKTVLEHYRGLVAQGVNVDVISSERDLSTYALVVAPMLYMVRSGIGEKIEAYVEQGGTFVSTYWSGIVNETDLTYLGGFPGPLRKTLGIWSEEIDALRDEEYNQASALTGNALMLNGRYRIKELCDLAHTETATTLMTYDQDFYRGYPALTVNHLGKGQAFYQAARFELDFQCDFYRQLIDQLGIARALDTNLPEGVSVSRRENSEAAYIFVMNFNQRPVTLALKETFKEVLTKETLSGHLALEAFGVAVLKQVK